MKVYGLRKTIEFSFIVNAVDKTVRAQINTIRLHLFEEDVRMFEIKITA